MPPASRPDHATGPLHAVVAALLALEMLPLALLLWTAVSANTSLSASLLPVNATGLLAFAVAAAAVVLGLLAADAPPRPGIWPLLVVLLLLPPVASLLLLLPTSTNGFFSVRAWSLAFVGVVNGQMVAAVCLRLAAASIPANRFRAAALDCIRPGQRLRHVVLPACAPALALLAALTFVGSWSSFLLAAALRKAPSLFASGFPSTSTVLHPDSPWQTSAGHVVDTVRVAPITFLAPGDYLTVAYVLASVPMIFLGLWTLRACLRVPAPRPSPARA